LKTRRSPYRGKTLKANASGELEFIGTLMDVTELKRARELQIALAREREHFAQQRAAELAKANEALRGCLDALASVPALDEFLGQVMAGITRQLGAVSSTLRLCHVEEKRLTLEFVFQDGRVMSPAEAKYPEALRSIPLDERPLELSKPPLGERAAILHLLKETVPIAEAHRAYLLGLGVKTLIVMPLILARRLIGRLAFRFTDEREFRPEDIEITRALASQASLAIHLIRLARRRDNLPFWRSATSWPARSMTRSPSFSPGSRCSWKRLRRSSPRGTMTALATSNGPPS
jgi:GAF domain-containing protein